MGRNVNWGDERIPANFWRYCAPEPNSGCWLWTGSLNHGGYGKTFHANRHWRAHRFAYERLVAQIPDGLQLDHLCRTPCCVNPAHLEPVTPRENTMRGQGPTKANANKTHCKRGHEMAGDNLAIRAGGTQRDCRQCHRDRTARWHRDSRARKRSAHVITTTPSGESGEKE